MKRRYTSFTRLTKLSLACTLVAVGYIGYRGLAILGPNGAGSLFRPTYAAIEIGCDQDSHIDESQATAASTVKSVSSDFQKFLANQPATGTNLLPNTGLTTLDFNSRAPQHYYRTLEDKDLSYHLYYDEVNKPYLHVTSDGKPETHGSWVTDMAPVQTNTTYLYSFSFRASTKATVTAEYLSNDNKRIYEVVAHLDAADTWQTFTNYFDNTRGAKAFRFIVALDKPGQLDTRNFDIHQIANARLEKGMVSIAFDDGWQSIADRATPLLQKYDIRTTQYIITTASEKRVNGYMDDKAVRKLKNQGHEIASHTLLHCDQTKVSDDDLVKNALDSKNQLEEQGLGPITSFAYPYGTYSERTQQIFTQNYQFIRTSDEGYNDRYFDAQRIKSFAIRSATNTSEFKAMIDHAKQHKQWLVLVYHRVDEHGDYNITTGNLDKQLRIIRDSGLSILPISEAATKIR
jgi:peptidoglycan/xylan/chitin deacetylase (PgdA/CDA1 family)